MTEECQKLWARTADLRDGERRSVDVDVDLGNGRRLTGTVSGVYGNRVVSLGYSRLKPRQRLRTWINLLALSAGHPDEHWTAHAVGRERAGPKRALSGPLDHHAHDWLRDLVELRDQGLTEPLPVPIATAAAWADAYARELMGQDAPPIDAARREWETDPHNPFGIEGEDADPYHQRVFGPRAPVEKLLDGRAARPRLDDLGAAAHRRREGRSAVSAPELAPFDITGDAAHPAPSCSRPAPAPARPGPSVPW